MKAFLERLKAMPTWQKVLLGMAVVGVVGFALYMRSKNSQKQTTPTTLSSGLLNGVDTYGNPLNNNGYSGLPGYGGTPGGTPGSTGTTITPGFVGPPQKKVYSSYTVSQSESLNDVAYAFGLTPQQLLAMNPGLSNYSWTDRGAYAGHDVTVNAALAH